MTATFSHLALTVENLEPVAAFYVGVFGFSASEHPYVGRGRRLAQVMEVPHAQLRGIFLRKDGFCLELLEYASAHRARPLPIADDDMGFCHLSFVVDDIDAIAALIAAHGGEYRANTCAEFAFAGGGVTDIAFCVDPEGNRIELIRHHDSTSREAHGEFLGANELGWPVGLPQD
ncbi:MAG: VOC family protein [Acidimicrobiia bacterium]